MDTRKCYIICLSFMMMALACMAQPDKVYRSLAAIKNPDDVYILRLSHKRLSQVPEIVCSLTNLRELDLSRNNLRTLPPEIINLQNLEVLKLGRNMIDSLPIEIAQLSHLRELDLSRNPIERLPEEMGYMLTLERLILWSTPLYQLPASFAELDGRLLYLDMRSCQLTHNDQTLIRELLPSPRIVWDQACNCR